jgi:hypothetical protein
MKYYKINESINVKEIGNNWPQIEEAEYTCDPFEDEEFIGNIGFKKVDFKPKLPLGKLHKKAQLTDLLSAVPIGFNKRLVISDKLKNIIPDKGNYQLFSTKIKLNKNNIINYWFLNPINFDYDNIDFLKSEYYLITDYFSNGEKLNIKSKDELLEESRRIDNLGYPYQLKIEKVVLNNKNNNDFIIINNTQGGISYFVSENLKKIIETEKITGIKFEII